VESLDVIRPNSVLRRPNRRGTPRLEVAHCLVSATIRPRLPCSASVLDGGTIIPSTLCISPGRWHFSWSWGESNHLARIVPHPGQGVALQVVAGFRVTAIDRE
jgi:hypothetical protein